MPRQQPTFRQLVFGRRLRGLRAESKLTADAVAARLDRVSQAKVSRWEGGLYTPSEAELDRVLDLYGADDAVRAELQQWRREAQQRGWWTNYSDVFSGPFIAAEDGAERIRAWEPLVVPGLLQTGEYARAVFEAFRSDDPDLERHVQARLARQALLGRPDAPELRIVLHENVLELPVGGRDVMRGQIAALRAAVDRGQISLRILPKAVGAHAGLGGPFVIFDFEQVDSIAFTENPAVGNVYQESIDRVNATILTYGRIEDAALSVGASADLLTRLVQS